MSKLKTEQKWERRDGNVSNYTEDGVEKKMMNIKNILTNHFVFVLPLLLTSINDGSSNALFIS